MPETKTEIWVTIAVNIGGETKTFAADASTTNDPYDLAYGVLSGLDEQAGRWLSETGQQRTRDRNRYTE